MFPTPDIDLLCGLWEIISLFIRGSFLLYCLSRDRERSVHNSIIIHYNIFCAECFQYCGSKQLVWTYFLFFFNFFFHFLKIYFKDSFSFGSVIPYVLCFCSIVSSVNTFHRCSHKTENSAYSREKTEKVSTLYRLIFKETKNQCLEKLMAIKYSRVINRWSDKQKLQ